MVKKRSGSEERIVSIIAIIMIKQNFIFDKTNWLELGQRIGLTGTDQAIRQKAYRYYKAAIRYQNKALEKYKAFMV
jgi:hypothetical protein